MDPTGATHPSPWRLFRRPGPALAALALIAVALLSVACVLSGSFSYARWRLSSEGRATHAYQAAGKAEASRRCDDAIRLYEKALRLAPASPELLYRAAVARVEAGRVEEFWPTMDRAADLGYRFAWELEDEPALRDLRTDGRYAPLLARIKTNERTDRWKGAEAGRIPDPTSVPSFTTLAAFRSAYEEKSARLAKEASRPAGGDGEALHERRLEAWRIAALRRYLDEHREAPDRNEASLTLVRSWASMYAYSSLWDRGTAAGIRRAAEEALALDLSPVDAAEMRFIRAMSVYRGVLADDWALADGIPPHPDRDAAAAQPLFDELVSESPTDPWSTRAAAYAALCALTTRPARAREDAAAYRARPAIPAKPWIAWDAQVRNVARETRLRLEGPPDFEARTIEGKPVSLSAFKGRVVLVDFWSPG